jgi:hypothetical protein
MLWWFPAWTAAGVSWWCWTDTELGYWDGQDQDPADTLRHYQGKVRTWMLYPWTSDTVFTPAFSLTTNWHHFCTSSWSHTHIRPFLSFQGRSHCDLGKKFWTGWSTGLNASCKAVVIFCDEMNCQFIYSITATDHSNSHFVFNLSNTSIFSGRYHFNFISSLGFSLVHTSPFPELIKTWDQQLVLQILESTAQVLSVRHNIYVVTECDRWADEASYVLLHASTWVWTWMSEGPNIQCMRVAKIILLQVSKTIKHEQANKEGLLCTMFCCTYIQSCSINWHLKLSWTHLCYIPEHSLYKRATLIPPMFCVCNTFPSFLSPMILSPETRFSMWLFVVFPSSSNQMLG